MQEFENFLRGCGFYFNGRVDIVEEEYNEEWKLEEFETPQGNWPSVVNSMMNPPVFRAAGLTGKNS